MSENAAPVEASTTTQTPTEKLDAIKAKLAAARTDAQHDRVNQVIDAINELIDFAVA